MDATFMESKKTQNVYAPFMESKRVPCMSAYVNWTNIIHKLIFFFNWGAHCPRSSAPEESINKAFFNLKNILTKSTIDPGVSPVLFLRWLSLTNLRVSLWSQASSTPLHPLSPPHTNPLVLTEPCSVLLRHQQQAPTTASRLRPGTSSFRHRASLARSRCTRRPSLPPVQSAVVSALVPLTWPSLLSMSSSAICRSDSSTSLTLFHFQLLFLRFLSPRLEEEIFFFLRRNISQYY